MKKKILAMALALCMAFGSAAALPEGVFTDTGTGITASAWGEEILTSGDYKYYVNDDGTVTISEYTGSDRSVSIPSKIKGRKVITIASRAFANCTKFNSLTIPSTVRTLGYEAFYGCTSLTSITVPESVKEVGEDVFENCTSIRTATVNSSVVGRSMFYGCSSLATVVIGANVTAIEQSAFNGCTALREIKIPKRVTSIGNYAFENCSALRTAVIGEGVTSIGSQAFYSCKSLSKLTIGSNVTSIGYEAFYGCISLPEVTIPSKVTEFGTDIFAYCSSLKKATLKDGVAYVGDSMFYMCTALSDVYISKTASSIEQSAFNGCKSLAKVEIPDSVEKIQSYAFKDCNTMKSASLGKGITSIGYEAFRNCAKLTSIVIPSMVANVGNSAFRDCKGLKTATIKDGCTMISYEMFCYCDSLTSVSIPNTITAIGEDSFYGCTALKSIKIPNSVTEIGKGAFYKCMSLTSATIGNNVTQIGSGAFQECSSLKKIIIPGSVTEIGSYAFEKCSELKEAYILDGIITIGYQAFNGCTNLSYAYIGKTAITVGEDAFYGAIMPYVTIPKSVVEIGRTAFGYVGWNSRVTDFTVRGFKGSEAQTYANNNGFKFEAVDGCKCKAEKKSITIEPTCYSKGYKLTICTRCGKATKSNYTATTKHSYCEWTVTEKATCTEKGEKVRYCKLCGEKQEADVAKLGHKWGNWKVTKKATCTTAGIQTRTCSTCGKKETKTIKALGHKWSKFKVTKKATCTTAGTQTRTCSTCGKKETKTIKATGHKYSNEWKTVAFDLKKNTSTIKDKCKTCGKYVFTQNVADAVHRFAGSDRAETATLVASSVVGGISKTANTVVIATGFDFHDALAAVPLASAYNAPLLLADRDNLSAKTISKLKSLKPKNVIVVATKNAKDKNGNDAAIKRNVYKQIKKALKKYNLISLEGSSYYETAKKVAIQMKKKTSKNPTSVFITTDKNFADALSASPVAAVLGAPILYVKSTGAINSYTKNYLKSIKSSVKKVYIVGGVNAVSTKVEKAVLSALGKKSATRFAGNDRYDTCIKINKAFASTLTGKYVFVAKGYNFPDALAGGVYAAKQKAPLFLADDLDKKATLTSEQKSFLKSRNARRIYVLGGETAIPTALVKSIAKASV